MRMGQRRNTRKTRKRHFAAPRLGCDCKMSQSHKIQKSKFRNQNSEFLCPQSIVVAVADLRRRRRWRSRHERILLRGNFACASAHEMVSSMARHRFP
jgi:hypothetical protein